MFCTLKSHKKLVDYANTSNVEFIVDPKVIYSMVDELTAIMH